MSPDDDNNAWAFKWDNTKGKLNNYNRKNAFPVRSLSQYSSSCQSFMTGFLLYPHYIMKSLLYDLFQAYYDARRNKRNTYSQLEFEIDYESNLMQLHHELSNGIYTIGQSTCFLICDTVPREIFAASFRDRVVHHLLYNYIYDICDKQFINDSYSCRVGKGTHYGVKRVDHFIRSCSENYTKDCYILKLDIKGFFMNIDKEILLYQLWHMIAYKREKILCSLGFDWLYTILKDTIFHDPTKNYIFQGSPDLYKVLPTDKSLFSSKPGIGLPIGNLTSQLLANVYLHTFDIRIKNTLGCRYYGRYVDDFIIIHHDKYFLIQCIPQIREYLQNQLSLTLHRKKIYLQHYTKGVKFLGAYIKPHRIYINRRTMGNAKKSFREIRTSIVDISAKQKHIIDIQLLRDNLAVANSYLGMMSHRKNYKKRVELGNMLSEVYKPNHIFTKITVKKHGTSIPTTSL